MILSIPKDHQEIARTDLISGSCTIYANRIHKTIYIICKDLVTEEVQCMGPINIRLLPSMLITLRDVFEGV